jgi:hypothetical protein
LRGFPCWPSIVAQVLDGPPGFTTRRLSSFLLIPVGTHRQGFAFLAASQARAIILGPIGTSAGQALRHLLNSLFGFHLRKQIENTLRLQFGGAAKIRGRVGNVALLLIDFAAREIAFDGLLLRDTRCAPLSGSRFP